MTKMFQLLGVLLLSSAVCAQPVLRRTFERVKNIRVFYLSKWGGYVGIGVIAAKRRAIAVVFDVGSYEHEVHAIVVRGQIDARVRLDNGVDAHRRGLAKGIIIGDAGDVVHGVDNR